MPRQHPCISTLLHALTCASTLLPPDSDLIELINGPLSKNDRKRLITLCTVDVHARDVVQRLIDERVENGQVLWEPLGLGPGHLPRWTAWPHAAQQCSMLPHVLHCRCCLAVLPVAVAAALQPV